MKISLLISGLSEWTDRKVNVQIFKIKILKKNQTLYLQILDLQLDHAK